MAITVLLYSKARQNKKFYFSKTCITIYVTVRIIEILYYFPFFKCFLFKNYIQDPALAFSFPVFHHENTLRLCSFTNLALLSPKSNQHRLQLKQNSKETAYEKNSSLLQVQCEPVLIITYLKTKTTGLKLKIQGN